jgi:methyl-accepting chemotaxis protein
MVFLRNINLRQRFIGLVVTFCLVIVVVGGIGLHGMGVSHDGLRELYAQLSATGTPPPAAKERYDQLQSEYTRIRNIEIAGLAAAIGVITLFAVLLLRGIMRAVDSVRATLASMAKGDMTARVAYRGGELRRLIESLNQTTDKLQTVLIDVNGASTHLATAAEELSAVTVEADGNVKKLQSETDQVATAMNEMSTTAQGIARNAAHAAEAARDADKQAADGAQVVSQTTDVVQALVLEMEKSTVVVNNLDKESTNIGVVLDVIKGIATQINLLALNASIEAARAGEHGRGFAVVADEVRTLASRTQQSTLEIQQMIERLQSGARNAVHALAESCSHVSVGVAHAQRAREALQAITVAVARINDMNTQIACAAEEQSAVAGEINRNVHAISEIGTQTSAGTNQTAAASEELANLAAHLKASLAQFKIHGSPISHPSARRQ